MSSSLLTSFFFKFLAFFPTCFVVSYLQIKQTKKRWVIEILITHFFAVFKASRPETFETETTPEAFESETETRKNGSRDRDQVSGLHYWHSQSPSCEFMVDVKIISLYIECSLLDHGICSALTTICFPPYAANWLLQIWFGNWLQTETQIRKMFFSLHQHMRYLKR